MANKYYQYETSPRKLTPEYEMPKNKTKKKSTKANVNKKKANTSGKKFKSKSTFKLKCIMFFHIVIIFIVLLLIIYRNVLIGQSFSQIQNLKNEITKVQKENDQLEISIQNSMNINNIEQVAKELLGMQKLTSKQTVYLTLTKKDYVEPSTEEVIIEDDTSIFSRITNYINEIF